MNLTVLVMMSRIQLDLGDDPQLLTAKASFSRLFSCLPRPPKYDIHWDAWTGTLGSLGEQFAFDNNEAEFSPLHLAVWNMHHEAVKVLLADALTGLSQIRLDGAPLHLAVLNNDVQMIDLLLQAGVDIEDFNESGYTAMQYAAGFGLVDAITALQRAGGDVESDARPIQPEGVYERGPIPMHLAARHGQVEAIKALKQLGVDVSIKSKNGWTPMHIAAETGQCDAITVLKELGAEVSPLTDSGKTPLQIAKQWKQDKAVETLIAAGAQF
jgi:ankyrin repeat protein